MDAIVYLRKEHNEFRKALKEINKISNENTRLSKFDAFAEDLTRHEAMEEEIWYPVLRKNKDLRDIIKHLIAEEKSAAKAIKSLQKTDYGFIWKLKFMKFKHDVDHHANEEEQELFPEVRKYLSKAELKELGERMREFKADY